MILHVDTRPQELDLERAKAIVHPERYAYAMRYRFAADRRLSLSVYLLLVGILREHHGIDELPRLETDENGKPFMPAYPELCFNFSHARGLAACAVSDSPVGVDVESVAPVDSAVLDQVLSASERASVAASPCPELTFARLWTRKEAVLKRRGERLDVCRLSDILNGIHAAELNSFELQNHIVSIAGKGAATAELVVVNNRSLHNTD